MHEFDNFRRNVLATIEARQLKKLHVAASLNTSRSWLDKVLKGQTDPTFSRAADIAKAVGVPLRELVLPPAVFAESLPALAHSE